MISQRDGDHCPGVASKPAVGHSDIDILGEHAAVCHNPKGIWAEIVSGALARIGDLFFYLVVKNIRNRRPNTC